MLASMRTLLALVLASGLAAADTPPPAAALKLVDDAVAAATKIRQAYEGAMKKEQEKLVASLTKEQERETKKGNLDGALAIKALIEQVQKGLLSERSEIQNDLLGEGARPAKSANTGATLSTDCPLPPETPRSEGIPAAIAAAIARASMISIPKGDRARYTFSASAAGIIAVQTGGNERAHAELWAELIRAGFTRLDDGAGTWYSLDAKPGVRFQAWDPPASAQVHIYAGQFRQAR